MDNNARPLGPKEANLLRYLARCEGFVSIDSIPLTNIHYNRYAKHGVIELRHNSARITQLGLARINRHDDRYCYIYGLIDPVTRQIRYVGQTKNIEYRYSQHLQDKSTDTAKSKWINELDAQGLKPEIVILYQVDTTTEDINLIEAYFIDLMASNENRLLNMTNPLIRKKIYREKLIQLELPLLWNRGLTINE